MKYATKEEKARMERLYTILEKGKIVKREEVMRTEEGTAVRGYKIEYEEKTYAMIAINGAWAYYMEV